MRIPSELEQRFISEHLNADIPQLILSASQFPEIKEMAFVAEQIEARQRIKDKLPDWYKNNELVFPSRLSTEQCSSFQTASYKQRLVEPNWKITDLTGGLGIDSFYLSRKVAALTYVEKNEDYCEAARNNFTVLDASNINVVNADTTEIIEQLPICDAFYIDPSRRGTSDRRLYALSDCEPNLPEILPLLLKKAPIVIAKLSPMADLISTIKQLPKTKEIHILSVKNECKELVFVISRDIEDANPEIFCANYLSNGDSTSFIFRFNEEHNTMSQISSGIKHFLYEPDASVMKSGAFKLIAQRFGIEQLETSSHLYTSNELMKDFPGRIFSVDNTYPFNNRICRQLSETIPQASIAVRNFPLSAEDLRKKLKIADGNEIYLFATTLADKSRTLIVCRKV